MFFLVLSAEGSCLSWTELGGLSTQMRQLTDHEELAKKHGSAPPMLLVS